MASIQYDAQGAAWRLLLAIASADEMAYAMP
jgi:hypothetical protein